jgi:hypothetical protein
MSKSILELERARVKKARTTNLTVRFTFLTQSVCLTPTFQGVTWFDCRRLDKEELLIICINSNLEDFLHEFIINQWALKMYKFCLCDERNTEHFLTQRFHCTFTFILTYLLTPWSRVLLEKLTSFRS